MNDPNGNEAFVRRAKARFDESVERLDASAQARLNQARSEALAARGRTPARNKRGWLPATGVLTAVAIAVVLLIRPDNGIVPVPETADADVELLLGEDELEMVEELEFYYWMEQLNAHAAN